MKQLFFITAVCLAALTTTAQKVDTTKRLLVVSGGGARGAWGVGVASELIKRNGGYQAVFGTSTGSLMAPLILLKDMDQLQQDYTSVTEKSIFNKPPFSVNYDTNKGTVTTSLNFRAYWRFIFGYKTFGVSKNLLKLIKHCLSQTQYDSLILLYQQRKMIVAVAVTNTTTGNIKIVYDSTFAQGPVGYDAFCHWVWASANEPLYMSYVPINDTNYVDGGVREVIPIQDGLEYALDHDIDIVDVIINNARVPINQNWSVSSGGILSGLERLLSIYDYGTVRYNESFAILLAKYFDLAGQVPAPEAERAAADAAPRRIMQLNFYCMPPALAQKYQNELGFVQPAMLALLEAGIQYGADSTQYCYRVKLDRAMVLKNRGLLNKKDVP